MTCAVHEDVTSMPHMGTCTRAVTHARKAEADTHTYPHPNLELMHKAGNTRVVRHQDNRGVHWHTFMQAAHHERK